GPGQQRPVAPVQILQQGEVGPEGELFLVIPALTEAPVPVMQWEGDADPGRELIEAREETLGGGNLVVPVAPPAGIVRIVRLTVLSRSPGADRPQIGPQGRSRVLARQVFRVEL